MEPPKELRSFFDPEGRLKVWPSKPEKKTGVIKLLAQKFLPSREYSEKEVNDILKDSISFGDYQLIRREMIMKGCLCRLPDGSKYWRPEEES